MSEHEWLIALGGFGWGLVTGIVLGAVLILEWARRR